MLWNILKGHHVVADFVCPTPEARSLFKPDYLFWMNTIEKGKFEDTNNLFVKPKKFDMEIKTKNSDFWVKEIVKKFFVE